MCFEFVGFERFVMFLIFSSVVGGWFDTRWVSVWLLFRAGFVADVLWFW